MTTPYEPAGEPGRTRSDLRAVAVLAGAVALGGVGGFALTDLTGAGDLRWGGTEVSALAAAIGGLVVPLVAGKLLLGGPALRVRAPGPLTGWPGTRFGAAALIIAPLLLLAAEAVRSGYDYFFPAQLAAMARAPGTILTSYALYTAGLVLLIPAFFALAALIARERPWWAFWGVTIALVGSTVRIYQEGIGFLALRLVPAEGLETATAAVSHTYRSWYVLQTLDGSDNLAWAVLAIGAYRARVLGWVPAIGVAFMLTHYSGVLKGTDLSTLLGAVLLAAVFVPLGADLWRRAEPVSRRVWWAGAGAVALLAAQYLLAALTAPAG